MKKVDNIIFDFGDVLLNLDFKATENQLVKLVGDFYSFSVKKNEYPDFFEKYEIGNINEEAFLSGLQEISEGKASKEDLKSAWNAMLLDVPPHRLEMLLKLKQKYRVFLLSNTNKTHIDFVMNYLKEEYNIEDWDTRFFEKTYYSHLVRMRKPNADIYKFVLSDSGLKVENTLFVDDNPANIEAAKKLGFQTILHNDGRDVLEALNSYFSN